MDTNAFYKLLDFIKQAKLDKENATDISGLQTIIVINNMEIYGERLYLKVNRKSYCKGIISILKENSINNSKIEAIIEGFDDLNYY